ncbi:MAG: YchJ family protein [Parachlamydiales bacterium]
MNNCPCHSGLPYPLCCQPYHKGRPAPTPLALMRSRYSAYALRLADYIIATTHPLNPKYLKDKEKWRREILAFSQAYPFTGLQILHNEGDRVTFHAILDPSHAYTEESLFKKEGEQWYYLSGVIK